MQDIPQWIKNFITKEKCLCSQCKTVLKEKNINAIGIKYSYTNPLKEALYIEFLCIKCATVLKYEIKNMLLVELALDIIQNIQEKEEHKHEKENENEFFEIKPEDYKQTDEELSQEEQFLNDIGLTKDENPTRKKIKKEKSKITSKDIKENSQFLKNIKSHHDLLEAMGMNPEEIVKYNIKESDK